jgi:hypothetical protein
MSEQSGKRKQQQQETETYGLHERPMTFVHQGTGIWNYCVDRFRTRWENSDPPHSIPIFRGGWWFPEVWAKEYNQRGPTYVSIGDNPRSEAEMEKRRLFVESKTKQLGEPGRLFSVKEMESWRLPVRTEFVADDGGYVIYPNGSRETWAAIEARNRPAAPVSWMDKPLTEETVATASPELKATLKRQDKFREWQNQQP